MLQEISCTNLDQRAEEGGVQRNQLVAVQQTHLALHAHEKRSAMSILIARRKD